MVIGENIFEGFDQFHHIGCNGAMAMFFDVQRAVAALMVFQVYPIRCMMVMLHRDEAQCLRVQCNRIVFGKSIFKLELIVKPKWVCSFHGITLETFARRPFLPNPPEADKFLRLPREMLALLNPYLIFNRGKAYFSGVTLKF